MIDNLPWDTVIAYCGVILLAIKWSIVLVFYPHWFNLFPRGMNLALAFLLCLSGLEGFGLGLAIFANAPIGVEAVVWAGLYVATDVVAYGLTFGYLAFRHLGDVRGPGDPGDPKD